MTSTGPVERSNFQRVKTPMDRPSCHPEQYTVFADEYYERDVDVRDVAAIYRHEPLSVELVRRLNPDVDLASLADDVAEIGYTR